MPSLFAIVAASLLAGTRVKFGARRSYEAPPHPGRSRALNEMEYTIPDPPEEPPEREIPHNTRLILEKLRIFVYNFDGIRKLKRGSCNPA